MYSISLIGGGELPRDPVRESILDTLIPASKDGVVARGKGESAIASNAKGMYTCVRQIHHFL